MINWDKGERAMSYSVDPAQAVCALERCYQEYVEGFRTLQAGVTVQDILAGWVGTGKVKEQQSALFEEYMEKGRGCVADLCAATEELAPCERSQWVEKAIETILFYEKTDSDLIIMLIAMEALAEPLIPLLEKEAGKKLCDRYQKRTPRYRMLPNQSKLLKCMKKNIQE